MASLTPKRCSVWTIIKLIFAAALVVVVGAKKKNHSRRAALLSGRCERIQVPMCKGLVRYNATKLPNRFGHKTQTEVYWALQPWWPFIDAGCSDNLRNFLCGLFLPKCVGADVEPQYPCQETCSKARQRCKKVMRQQGLSWAREFKCEGLLPKSSRRCVRPKRERKKKSRKEYVLCQVNRLPMCQDIPFQQGSLPNMFLQGDIREIEQEMRQYQPLLESGCSNKLRLFLCGVYMPFCVPGEEVQEDGNGEIESVQAPMRTLPDVPFVLPCRELCQEVYDQCSGEYGQRTHGLPWPGKFHCHRYPSYHDRYTVNNETSAATIPCTMAPYNFQGN